MPKTSATKVHELQRFMTQPGCKACAGRCSTEVELRTARGPRAAARLLRASNLLGWHRATEWILTAPDRPDMGSWGERIVRRRTIHSRRPLTPSFSSVLRGSWV